MTKLYRKIRAPFEHGAIHVAMRIIPRLPRRGVLLLAEIGGRLGYHLDRTGRHIGMANLALAFGDNKTLSEKNRILKASSITMARTLIDTFWFAHAPAERLEKHVEIDESFCEMFKDKPLICISAHFGNWEIMGQITGHKGTQVSSIATPVKNATVNKEFIRAREATGQKIIPRNGALRKLLSALRKKENVAFLADQNTKISDGGVWVAFFGIPALVTGAPALLAARTKTEIIMAFCSPQPAGKYKAYITQLIAPPSETNEEALLELTQQITRITEEEIRKHPEHWLWTYKRWRKIQDPLDTSRYPFYSK
jgi:Kdo2-lipid IVA lauroyltransferase/acyltransferase